VRADVVDAVEEVRENEQNDELRPRRERRRGRAAQEAVEPDQSQDTDRQAPETWSGNSEAPSSWSREAKREWDALSSRVRHEILKREGDMGRGASAVHKENEQIKQNVAQFAQQHTQVYGEIDNAIRPYAQVIQNFGKTPGQAVGQLFAWFDSLARNPDVTFPALVQSYRYDGTRLAGNLMRQAGWHIQPTREGGFYVTRNPQAHQQNYQNQLDQRVAAIEQATQQQQAYQQEQIQAYQWQQQQIAAENTERMLEQWAEGREHFEEVRVLMGTLLTPDPQTGQAAVPLKSDGAVDLETAYRWAVRAKFGDRVAADQEYATKARRKASSLTNSAPGRNNGGSRQREKALGTSVRDDIKAAIREVSDR
jgi:hypothetical protein